MNSSWPQRVLFYLVLSVYAFVLVLPLLTLFSASFRSDAELYTRSWIPPHPTLESYHRALTQFPIVQFLLNSLVVASTITAGVVLLSLTTGYALARIPFRGQALIFGVVVGLLLMPGEVTFLPLYLLISRMGWIDSYWALVVPFLASPLGIFLMRQFMKGLPQELFDAARMDGAGHLRMLWHVAIPLSAPAVGALAALTFLSAWNMYLWPLIVTKSREMQTAQIAVQMIVNDEVTRYNVVAAGAVIVLLPTLIIFLVAQRAFVRGIALGGVKG